MELISTKFSSIENDIKSMLEPLKNNQTFLRLTKYLSDFPYEQQYFDTANNIIVEQPDIPMPYDLIGDRTILLTLMNPNIITDAKIYMFFSHLDFNSNESRSVMTNHNYLMDIVIPYQNIQMDDKLRNIRIVDEVMKALDNQYIAGENKVFIRKGKDYIVNKDYQGITLNISVENSRV